MENKIVAKLVNKEITEMDLKAALGRFAPDKQKYLETEQGRTQLIDQLINFETFSNYGTELKLDEEIAFKEQMEAVKKEILVQYTIQKVMNEATVTEEEASDYYTANKDMFKVKEQVSAKHILVETEEKAKEIKTEIDGGVAFELAAAKYSSCPSNQEGGNLGSFSRGQMVPEFEDVAFSLEVGAVSDAVKTQFGYHLIKVEAKQDASEKTFEEVKSNIMQNLMDHRQRHRYLTKADELKEKYSVEII